MGFFERYLRTPGYMPSSGNETLIHTCTGQVEVVQGFVRKSDIILKPEGIPKQWREVGDSSLGVWKVSSCKDEQYGVEKLRDSLKGTCWQSDGLLPHTATLTYHKRTEVAAVYLYVSRAQDTSYCPHRVLIRAGEQTGVVKDITETDLENPEGWVKIPVEVDRQPVTCRVLEISIIHNFEHGKDSHVRQINVYGPKPNIYTLGKGISYQSLDFQRWMFPR